ncbi:pyrimidine dimer DNA glycosylase/endonuclease V [Arthrobacter mobilis]|uniref:Pyrimidine dimer DNA glycosylase n=1 Tax=Arthrobacter mobilis TaxID=2724944 RepID=A0A7X6HHS6_9MICC|nr:pyrimidine dimer DNA glycosylase/endonuclease V [Arthrobacter mobilis]NKX56027.1 pyrimidine dimer DNA glycosylase [Arthrobacter mobilis]
MRLWSVHPRYLDRQALTACWREALLAQAVLNGATRGYTMHPQLARFRSQPSPLQAVGAYLLSIADEAGSRGYRFDRSKVLHLPPRPVLLSLEIGQLDYEWNHLMRKLEVRSPDIATRWAEVLRPDPHPLFTLVEGPVAVWERPGKS